MHSKLPSALRSQIEDDPRASVDLILRVSEAGDVQQSRIEEVGLTVRHRTTLVPAFAVTGPCVHLLPLLDEQWLLSVEFDQPVRAL